MQLVIVSGSNRKNSNSRKVANYIRDHAANPAGFTAVDVIDLHEVDLPLWDESVWAGAEKCKTTWAPLALRLQAAMAVVLVAPEWAGMVPAQLKNFLLLASNKELAHKPAMIVGVSSGLGGAYPVAELRMSGYKNNHVVFVPDHLVIRDATNLLNGPTPQSKVDEEVRDRVVYSTRVLGEYAKALTQVRESGVSDFKKYPFGQ
jgi:NAD(P)H-dependent FMN reductase